jgi:hypothetical protein
MLSYPGKRLASPKKELAFSEMVGHYCPANLYFISPGACPVFLFKTGDGFLLENILLAQACTFKRFPKKR